MTPRRFPVTLVDFLSYSLRLQTDNGVGNFVMCLSGRIDESRLRRAIRLTLDAEPILGCQFVNHWRRPYWRRRQDLDELPLCTVVEDRDQGSAFVGFHTASLDPARDPLLKAMIFRGSTDTVCLKACHAVSDGPAGTRIFPAVVSLYRRLKDDPSFVPTPNEAGTRHLRDLGLKYGFREKLQLVRRILADRATPVATWLFPEYEGPEAFHGYVMLRLPPERVLALSRYARDRQATMTSVMLGGFYLAARRVLQTTSDEVMTFTTTADLRHFLPSARRNYTVANMSAPGRFQMDARHVGDFEEVLASIRDQLRRILKDPTCLPISLALLFAFPFVQTCIEAVPFSLLGRVIRAHYRRAIARPERRWVMVNAGQLGGDVLDLGDVHVTDAYGTGPMVMGGGLGVAFTIFRNYLTMSLGLSGRVMDQAVARKLLEQVDRELPFHSVAAGSVFTQAVERGSGGGLPGRSSPRLEVRT